GTRKTGQAFDGAEDRHGAPPEGHLRCSINRSNSLTEYITILSIRVGGDAVSPLRALAVIWGNTAAGECYHFSMLVPVLLFLMFAPRQSLQVIEEDTFQQLTNSGLTSTLTL